jgi:hypothetical protein
MPSSVVCDVNRTRDDHCLGLRFLLSTGKVRHRQFSPFGASQTQKKKRSEGQQGSCFNETNILEVSSFIFV